LRHSRSRAFQICNELVTATGRRHDLDELPAVLTPRVEDLLGGMDEQRHCRVLPFGHTATLRVRPAAARGRMRYADSERIRRSLRLRSSSLSPPQMPWPSSTWIE